MNPDYWGPHLWQFLHMIAENYPEKAEESDKNKYRQFYDSLAQVLPCSHCRESFGIFMNQFPPEPYLHSRQHLAFWTYEIHNIVNMKLSRQHGKKIVSPPFEKVRKTYEKYRGKNPAKDLRNGTPGSEATRATRQGAMAKRRKRTPFVHHKT